MAITFKRAGRSAITEFRAAYDDGETFRLFGADRFGCCDEAIVAWDGEVMIGLVTIAPYGEGVRAPASKFEKQIRERGGERFAGQPEIVGLYIAPSARRGGIGIDLFRAALSRCRQRKFRRVRVIVVEAAMMKLIARLGARDREYLEVIDATSGGDSP